MFGYRKSDWRKSLKIIILKETNRIIKKTEIIRKIKTISIIQKNKKKPLLKPKTQRNWKTFTSRHRWNIITRVSETEYKFLSWITSIILDIIYKITTLKTVKIRKNNTISLGKKQREE